MQNNSYWKQNQYSVISRSNTDVKYRLIKETTILKKLLK